MELAGEVRLIWALKTFAKGDLKNWLFQKIALN